VKVELEGMLCVLTTCRAWQHNLQRKEHGNSCQFPSSLPAAHALGVCACVQVKALEAAAAARQAEEARAQERAARQQRQKEQHAAAGAAGGAAGAAAGWPDTAKGESGVGCVAAGAVGY
jgi:hypothetical protein